MHKIKIEIEFIPLSESYPQPESEVILYREDAGVFCGYYGSLEATLSDLEKEDLYEHMTEADMSEVNFYYYDMSGGGVIQSDELPEYWAYTPNFQVVEVAE